MATSGYRLTSARGKSKAARPSGHFIGLRTALSVAFMRRKFGRGYEFLLGELIGEQLKVSKASSRALLGMEGKVIDETRNTFVLETASGRKRIPKAACTLYFKAHHLAVEGSLLVCRPEDRTKKLAREILK